MAGFDKANCTILWLGFAFVKYSKPSQFHNLTFDTGNVFRRRCIPCKKKVVFLSHLATLERRCLFRGALHLCPLSLGKISSGLVQECRYYSRIKRFRTIDDRNAGALLLLHTVVADKGYFAPTKPGRLFSTLVHAVLQPIADIHVCSAAVACR